MTSNDLVVFLPGIMGSTLGVRTGESPASVTPIWAPKLATLWRGLTGHGPNILAHQLPGGIGDDHPGDGVEPLGLMPSIHGIPGFWSGIRGYEPLITHLTDLGYRRSTDQSAGNLLPVPYDWRLSNRYNGQRLVGIVEPALERWRASDPSRADARVVFICHSMGGLVARWYVEKFGGAEITRKIITLGTPWRGATRALVALVNAKPIGKGPFRLDATAFVRSMPSVYQLLPEFACIESPHGYLKTVEAEVPKLDRDRLVDAAQFHGDLQTAERARAGSRDTAYMIIGTRQETVTTVSFSNGKAVASPTFGAENDYGDVTVPLVGAIGHDRPQDANDLHPIADHHGNLHRNASALALIDEVIAGRPVRRRGQGNVDLRVAVPDVVMAGDEVSVTVEQVIVDGRQHGVVVSVEGEYGGRAAPPQTPQIRGGRGRASFAGLKPGAYEVTVAGAAPGGPVNPVTATVMVWPNG